MSKSMTYFNWSHKHQERLTFSVQCCHVQNKILTPHITIPFGYNPTSSNLFYDTLITSREVRLKNDFIYNQNIFQKRISQYPMYIFSLTIL